jgi:hypothetical protein
MGFERQGLALSLRHFLDRFVNQAGCTSCNAILWRPKEEVIPLTNKTVSPCGEGSIRETIAPDISIGRPLNYNRRLSFPLNSRNCRTVMHFSAVSCISRKITILMVLLLRRLFSCFCSIRVERFCSIDRRA